MSDQTALTPLIRTPVLVVLSVMVAGAVAGLGRAPLFEEGGPVEMASAVGLLALAIVALSVRGRAWGWAVPVMLLLLAAREFDLDKSLLSDGMLKLRFYTGNAPPVEKAMGAVVIGLILATFANLLRRGLRPWLSALRAAAPWAVWLGVGLLAVVVAKSLDGIGRKLAPLGLELTEQSGRAFGALEETLELLFVLALVAAMQTWLKKGSP